MTPIGIYIHVPFCARKCPYCDFYSCAYNLTAAEKYTDAVIRDIKNLPDNIYADTLYFGGGTPSLLSADMLNKILDALSHHCHFINPEITLEVNPGTVNKEKLEDYFKIGINRLSIGLQSTNNNLLKEIGRIHTYEEFLNTYSLARKVGFNNINADLIIGLPKQTIADVENSVNELVNLKLEHISVYSLILEEGTMLEELVRSGKLKLPEDKEERNMYWKVKNILEKNGYNHYEISNFAKHGSESKHNLDCWKQKEYVGFGVAAHSYTNGVRYSNIENIEEYIKNYEEGKEEDNFVFHEKQTHNMKVKEYMMLGLRKIEGVCIQEFKEKFAANPIFVFKTELEKLVNEELLEVNGDYIKLTNKGLDLANIVWENFV